jgi:hydroxymethylpyrimidine pyrophosphatase-like HAD family hydrolase
MSYLALACDYDGTIAWEGHVARETMAALQRVRAAGRLLILVTGRELPDVLAIFPQVQVFHRVVAENGALLYLPETGEERVLARPVPGEFVAELTRRGVGPIAVGRTIIATREPHETIVLEAIRDLGLELQVIFNKGAVMVLPSGINKATGLVAALAELGLSPQSVVGVGDAENDHAFLDLCGYSVAVANALPAIKERADLVTCQNDGCGVAELIDRLRLGDPKRSA